MEESDATNAIRPVLRAVNAESGGGYRVVRKFTGGVRGAWLVRDRLHHDAVLKCIWDVDWRARLSTAAKGICAGDTWYMVTCWQRLSWLPAVARAESSIGMLLPTATGASIWHSSL
jgi:hypothetical protein